MYCVVDLSRLSLCPSVPSCESISTSGSPSSSSNLCPLLISVSCLSNPPTFLFAFPWGQPAVFSPPISLDNPRARTLANGGPRPDGAHGRRASGGGGRARRAARQGQITNCQHVYYPVGKGYMRRFMVGASALGVLGTRFSRLDPSASYTSPRVTEQQRVSQSGRRVV